MILNHLWGLYAHPVEEWHTIDDRHESFKYSMSHILLIALIPSICGYISLTSLGWSVGVGDRLFLSNDAALMISVGMYFALIGGVFALGYLAHWMAKNLWFRSNLYSNTRACRLHRYTIVYGWCFCIVP